MLTQIQTIPPTVLDACNASIKETFRGRGIDTEDCTYDFLKKASSYVGNQLGVVKDVFIPTSLSSDGSLLEYFSVSMALDEYLELSPRPTNSNLHLRLYCAQPMYIAFHPKYISESLQEFWAYVINKIRSYIENWITISLEEWFFDEELVAKGLQGLTVQEFEEKTSLYRDYDEDDLAVTFEAFSEYINSNKRFLTNFYHPSVDQDRTTLISSLDEKDALFVTQILAVLDEWETTHSKLWQQGIQLTPVDESSPLCSTYTLLLGDDDIENEAINSVWEYYNQDPHPIAIGLEMNASGNLKEFLNLFCKETDHLEQIMTLYIEYKE